MAKMSQSLWQLRYKIIGIELKLLAWYQRTDSQILTDWSDCHLDVTNSKWVIFNIILSRASEAGSPTNRQGSDKTRARDPLVRPQVDNYLDKNFKRNEPHT